MSETARQFERSVLTRLRALGRRLRWYVVLDGAPVVLIALLVFAAGTFVVDRSVWLTREMRVVQLLSIVAMLAAILWRQVLRPARLPVSAAELALLLENRFPQLRSRLITAVELAQVSVAGSHHRSPTSEEVGHGEVGHGSHPGSPAVGPGPTRSPAMIDAVIGQAEREAAGLRFTDVLHHRRVRKRGAVALASLVLLAGVAGAWHTTAALWFQRNVLLRDLEWPLRNRLSVEGLTSGRMIVPRGDDVTVSAVVDPGFEAPRQAYIEYEGEQGLRGRDQMPAVQGEEVGTAMPTRTAVGVAPDNMTRFTHTFERLGETLRCRIVGGDARTEPFTIQVVDRPRIEEITVGITPPAYTKADAYELRTGQTVAEALKGSRIRLRIRTNKPLLRASLVRQSAGPEKDVAQAERLGDQLYAASDLPEGTGTYYFRMVDELGLSNVSERTPPMRVSLRLVPDKPPKVKLRVKGAGEMITPQAVLPIETDFSNTYGLASARLVYELARKDAKPVTEPMAGFEPGTKTFAHAIDWVGAAHGLAEGDRLSLRAEATDFDNVSGPNLGQSRTLSLRVVSREELASELNRREQEYRQDFERLQGQQAELYSELLGAAAQSNVAGQERTHKLGQLLRLQRDLAGRCNSLRMQFEQVLSELRINGLATPTAEARLGGGIVEPMGFLAHTRMPAAGDELEALMKEFSPERLASARHAQEAVLADMKRILASMLKWEGFQEAVGLLRDIQKMQEKVAQETEQRIATEVLGTAPAK